MNKVFLSLTLYSFFMMSLHVNPEGEMETISTMIELQKKCF